MTKAFINKWVEGVTRTDSPMDVAERCLRDRLAAVRHYLPLAADKADDDVEHVHQLRAWSRRAGAALRLFDELLPRRRASWLKKQLKRIRRAANDARDCDVLIDRLKKRKADPDAKRWQKFLATDREQAQQRVEAVHRRLARDNRFARRVEKLIDRIRARGEKIVESRFTEWVGDRLKTEAQEFFSSLEVRPTDATALHQLRIQGKRLRHDLEIVAGAFTVALRTRIHDPIKAILDRLGEINDHATAITRLQRLTVEASDPRLKSAWQRLQKAEQTKLDLARTQLWKWCSPKMVSKLRRDLESILEDADAS